MAVTRARASANDEQLADFVRKVEPRLRQALVATYGPVDGREATVDALSWAWTNWDRIADLRDPVAYLYRVGQSAVRGFRHRSLPPHLVPAPPVQQAEYSPELLPALARLSVQQRTAVVLVHGHGWSQTDVAGLLGVNVTTVRVHLARGLARLRHQMEVSDDD